MTVAPIQRYRDESRDRKRNLMLPSGDSFHRRMRVLDGLRVQTQNPGKSSYASTLRQCLSLRSKSIDSLEDFSPILESATTTDMGDEPRFKRKARPQRETTTFTTQTGTEIFDPVYSLPSSLKFSKGGISYPGTADFLSLVGSEDQERDVKLTLSSPTSKPSKLSSLSRKLLQSWSALTSRSSMSDHDEQDNNEDMFTFIASVPSVPSINSKGRSLPLQLTGEVLLTDSTSSSDSPLSSSFLSLSSLNKIESEVRYSISNDSRVQTRRSTAKETCFSEHNQLASNSKNDKPDLRSETPLSLRASENFGDDLLLFSFGTTGKSYSFGSTPGVRESSLGERPIKHVPRESLDAPETKSWDDSSCSDEESESTRSFSHVLSSVPPIESDDHSDQASTRSMVEEVTRYAFSLGPFEIKLVTERFKKLRRGNFRR